MAGAKGFEPSVFSVTGRRVNQATPRTRDVFASVFFLKWVHVSSSTNLQKKMAQRYTVPTLGALERHN